jgi:5-methylcytosine-specific restriction endonuclease McrA
VIILKDNKLIRIDTKYDVKRILSRVLIIPRKKKYSRKLDGDPIYFGSKRLQVFKVHGVKCAKCDIEGQYFVKERSEDQQRYHLNLYAIDENGNEVLMTKDHIVPKSKGGTDDLNNLQTMCSYCNNEKGDTQ